MADRQVQYGIKLNASGDGLVGAFEKSSTAAEKFDGTMKKVADTTKSATDESSRLTQRLKEEADALNKARNELEASASARSRHVDGLRQTGSATEDLRAKQNAFFDSMRQQNNVVEAGQVQQARYVEALQSGASAMNAAGGAALAMAAGKSALRSALGGVLSTISGPAGLIAILGSAALSWASFGNAATDAGKKAVEAAREAKVAWIEAGVAKAEAEHTAKKDREALPALGGLFSFFQRGPTPSGLPGPGTMPENPNGRRLSGSGAGSAEADAMRGITTKYTLEAAYDKQYDDITRYFLGRRAGTRDPDKREQLDAEQEAALEALKKGYGQRLAGLDPKPEKTPTFRGDDGSAMVAGLRNQVAVASGDDTAVGAVTRRLAEGSKEYSEANKELALSLAAQLDAQKKSNAEAQAAAKEQEAAARATEAATKAYNQGVEAQYKSVASLQEHNARLAQHNREIGKTKAEVDAARASTAELTLAELEQQRALNASYDSQAEHVEILDARIAAQRDLVKHLREGAVLEANAATAKAASDEWKRTSDNIERALTDSILRGFDKGKSFLENFLDSLVNGLKSAVLTPIIQPIVRPMANMMTGAVQGIGSALFGGNSGGIGPWINGGGIGGGNGGGGFNPLSALSSFNSLAGNGLSSLFGASNFTAALAGDAFMPALLGAEGLGAAGLGSSLGAGLAAIPGWGWAAAGALALFGGDLFGGGGGPKMGEAFLEHTNHGWNPITQKMEPFFWIGQNNIPGGTDYNNLISTLNDPKQFDQTELLKYVGQPVYGMDGQSMIQQLMGSFGSAAQKAQANQALEAQQNAVAMARLQGSGALAGGLQGWIDGQSVSEYLSPEDRLSGARSLFDSALKRAAGGDADAARSLPGLADQLVGAGRSVYASSTQFQDLRGEVYGDLARTLQEQGAQQANLLTEMPAAVREGTKDQVAALEKLRKDMVSKLEEMIAALRERTVLA